jgi:hypothetical protein
MSSFFDEKANKDTKKKKKIVGDTSEDEEKDKPSSPKESVGKDAQIKNLAKDAKEKKEEKTTKKEKKNEDEEVNNVKKGGSVNIDPKIVYKAITDGLGPSTRDKYIENASVWFKKVVSGKTETEISDLVNFFIKACKRIPLHTDLIEKVYEDNKKQQEEFMAKAEITESAPQENIRRRMTE